MQVLPHTGAHLMSYQQKFSPKWFIIAGGMMQVGLIALSARAEQAGPGKPHTYMPVVVSDTFEQIYDRDTGEKDAVMSRQNALLEKRYDLRNDPSDVQMSGKRKAVQKGVRVRLPSGATWERLGSMSPEQIKAQNLFPMGFRP